MPQYAVIVENDITQWEDETGSRYHFPKRYARLVRPGTRLLHYKGRLRDRSFLQKRLSPEPYYFAFSIAGEHSPDSSSMKGDLFLKIEDFQPFDMPVPHRIDGLTLEEIPANRKENFWRDGVRAASLSLFERVAAYVGLFIDEDGQDSDKTDDDFTTAMTEGSKRKVYNTRYERRPELRAAAIRLHGTACFACDVELPHTYGEMAAGYIHVHHKKPLSQSGVTIVDPKTDLVPLCPNCHAMVHLGNKLRSVNHIRSLLGKSAIPLGE